MFRACDLEALPDAERDDCAMRLATSYLKEGICAMLPYGSFY